MKKILLAMVLVAAVVAVAQTASTPAQPQQTPAPAAAPQQNPAPAPAPQKKEIKDNAEYNAYVGAVQQTDPAAQISGLEAFVTQYPNSVVKEDALEQLMGAYQKTGNAAKASETAQKLLQLNPNNIRGLAFITFTKRIGAKTPQDVAEAAQYGERGLQALPTAPKPEGMSDADFQKFKTSVSVIFHGAVGMSAYQAGMDAVKNKDSAKADQSLAKAQENLRAAVNDDPADVNNIYPLALAYLQPGATEKDVDGLFFIARAANLIADPNAKAGVVKFGKSKYVKYHGSEEGWNDVMTLTATTTLPPPGFTIKQYIPPTPAEQAADLVKTKDPKDMSFAEWELVLSEGKQEDADKVWSFLKGKPLQMVAQVIAATASKVNLAGSSDDIEKKTADIELTMTAPMTARQTPAVGSDFQFEGTPVSYTAKPFLMVMNEGKLLVKAAPPVHKPPVHRKPPAN